MQRMFALAALAAMVAGCQAHTGLMTPEAQQFKRLIAERCIVATSVGGNYEKDKRQIGEDVIINSIDHGKNGWIRMDATTKAVRGNMYLNSDTGLFICGAENFSDRGLTFEPLE
ncbi:MAG: hypothetical protein KDE22_06575 [Rhodobacterales bacterium]|nr:hypothetical protein [Rhodobacterales bacterium]